MNSIRKKLMETLSVRVHVLARDILEGECCEPSKCMEKLPIERSLRELDPRGGDHKVRIDAGIVKFNLWGYHWTAMLPKKPKVALLMFDKETKARELAAQRGEVFVSKVKPHTWIMEAFKGSKIIPLTVERQQQINAARRKRIEEGRPDKPKYDLHRRVVGLASV